MQIRSIEFDGFFHPYISLSPSLLKWKFQKFADQITFEF